MSSPIPINSKITGIPALFVCLSMMLFAGVSCNNDPNPGPLPYAPRVVKWLNWNFYFSPNEKKSEAILYYYETSLSDTIHKYDAQIQIIITPTHCPCDPTLTNLDITLVGGTGGSIPPPPPANPKTGPQGDYVVNENLFFNAMPIHPDSVGYTIPPMSFSNIDLPHKPTDGRILAVIDTGLDTTEFKSPFNYLVWKNPLGETIYDVVPSPFSYSKYLLIDDNHVKHGTSATALALSQITNDKYPKIMPIRAFDSNAQGSIYTASCAMSCAIENHADYINASWGYRGKEDPILKSYIRKASDKGIGVIAAAGNGLLPHSLSHLCDLVPPGTGLLTKSENLFYPASFTKEMENVISVTQLNLDKASNSFHPCYYQNYGEDYVTTGIINEKECCSFRIPDTKRSQLEGSSFATPSVTGILMTATEGTTVTSLRNFVDAKSSKYPGRHFTRNGNYFIYQNH